MDEDVNKAAVNGSSIDVPSNPKLTRVAHHQLSKFQELQRRRLQLISKPKNKKFKPKGAKPKLQKEELGTKRFPDDNPDERINVTSSKASNSHETESNVVFSSSPQVNIHPAFQKKKLHWG